MKQRLDSSVGRDLRVLVVTSIGFLIAVLIGSESPQILPALGLAAVMGISYYIALLLGFRTLLMVFKIDANEMSVGTALIVVMLSAWLIGVIMIVFSLWIPWFNSTLFQVLVLSIGIQSALMFQGWLLLDDGEGE